MCFGKRNVFSNNNTFSINGRVLHNITVNETKPRVLCRLPPILGSEASFNEKHLWKNV